MPLPFGCFFLCLLLFLLNFYFSCGGVESSFRPVPAPVPSSPDTPCYGKCGGIEISWPFFLNNTDHACRGIFSIRCDPDSDSEIPSIKIADREFVVKYIVYEENIVILQDQELSGYLGKQQCGFLYSFTNPIWNFELRLRSPSSVYLKSSTNCARQTDAFSHAFFPTINSSQRCNGYNLYYWDESGDQPMSALSAQCKVARPTLSWKLSFVKGDKNLSLLSAGFSHWYELREDCFDCRVTGKSCASSSGATNSPCLCQDACTSMESERCGDLDVAYPFFTKTTPLECRGIFQIECDHNSSPKIQLNETDNKVIKISYLDKVITVQDLALRGFFYDRPCSFLYNFIVPIPAFEFYSFHPKLIANPFSCSSEGYKSFHDLLWTSYSFTPCNGYSLYYLNETSYNHKGDENCVGSHPNSFELVLSFREANRNLSFSLLAAGFSHQSVLRKECFNCQLIWKNCSSNDVSSYMCEPLFLQGKSTSRNRNIFIVIGAGFFLVFLLLCLLLALYFYKQRIAIICGKKGLNKNQNIEAFLEEYGALTPKRYSYSDVKKMTKSFQEKLGQGGYGTVFKGTLSNGHVIAVKMLNDSKGDGEEFINEVASIGRTSHVNVVSLLGFCFEGSKRALIYAFMCNGSLEKLLYTEEPKTTLDWEKLYRIAIGIARGLEYLHRGCIMRIVHFDIKPHNILLDQDFCPKISDFGLAKLCLKKDSIISIAGARGTIGYIAPEVFSRNFGVVSSKSDVYSYGMMVLEIAGGRRKIANAGVENSSEAYFPHWIYEYLDQNRDLLAYGVTAESEETVRKMILVGLWCIQTMPQNRPPMSRVIEMLEGSVNDLQVPPKPYLSSSTLGPTIGSSSLQDICWVDSSC